MLAIAAMAAFSCNKEIKPQEELTPVSEPKVIVAYTDKDVLPDTKTSLSGVEIIWSETDAIKGLDYDGNVHTASNPTIEEQGKKATFTFQDLSIVDDIFTLAYPASVVTDIDGDYVYASIPSEQKATPSSFADGANLAIADGSVEVPVFKNVGGLLSIVINNDNIASVKLTANESLTGAAKISTAGENYASATITGGSSEVTLSGGLNNGDPYYAVVYPGTYTGLQIVITDNDGRTATYANPNKLVVGRNANLFIAELTVADSKWVDPDPFEGEWILTGIKGEQAYACGKYVSGNNIQNVKEITIDEGSKSIEGENLDECKITITKVKSGTYQGYYTIQDSNESDNYWYAAGTSTNNYLRAGALSENDKYFWSISENEGAHKITAKSTNRNTIKFNTDGTSTIFSCYASDGSQASVTLYPYSWVASISRTAVSLSFNPATPDEITFGDDFTEPTLIKNPSDAPVTYSVETNPEGIASIDASTGGLTITGAGTITVTASVSDEVHYKPASAYYTLTVKELISDYSTAGTSNVALSTTGGTSASTAKVNSFDALKAGTSEKAGAIKITVPAKTTNLHLHAAGWNNENVTLSITGAAASPNSLSLTSNSGISGSSPFTLSGGSNVADYYFNVALTGITAETTLTFTATSGKRFVIWGVNAADDNRLDPEMTWSNESATASITNSGVTFTAPTLNLGYTSSVTYDSTEPSVATVESDGTVNILAAGTTKIQAIFAGDATYKPSTKEYTLNVTDDRTYAITVTQPAEGGSISATPSGSQKAGTTINLSADATDGFKLGEWIVYKTGDESTKVTVNGNSFEMPAYPVTITASFTIKTTEKTLQDLYSDAFISPGGKAVVWDAEYSDMKGVTSVIANAAYTMTEVKVSKNGELFQETAGTNAVLVLGPLAVNDCEELVFTYDWKPSSIKKTYSTKLEYATSQNGTYTEVENSSSAAVSAQYNYREHQLPVAAQVNTLYIKITFNTSNTQAYIDNLKLVGKK